LGKWLQPDWYDLDLSEQEMAKAHHALLAERDRTIAELREVVNGMLPYFRMFVWADPTAQAGIVEQAESVLARKKEKGIPEGAGE